MNAAYSNSCASILIRAQLTSNEPMFQTDEDLERELADLEREDQHEYYTLLNVDLKATQEEIRSSYRRLCRIYHPDRLGILFCIFVCLLLSSVDIIPLHALLDHPAFSLLLTHFSFTPNHFLIPSLTPQVPGPPKATDS